MDIRQTLSGQRQSLSRIQLQNITNVAVYNLAKKQQIYNQLTTQYTNEFKTKLGASSYLTIFSYKPLIYSGLALLFHLSVKRISVPALFIHVSAIVLINNYDLNKGVQKASPQKWKQYKEACKNYQRALSIQKVSIWKYLKSMGQDHLAPSDFAKIFRLRPH